eukprot:27993-Hanusia_phi.AAC.2
MPTPHRGLRGADAPSLTRDLDISSSLLLELVRIDEQSTEASGKEVEEEEEGRPSDQPELFDDIITLHVLVSQTLELGLSSASALLLLPQLLLQPLNLLVPRLEQALRRLQLPQPQLPQQNIRAVVTLSISSLISAFSFCSFSSRSLFPFSDCRSSASCDGRS